MVMTDLNYLFFSGLVGLPFFASLILASLQLLNFPLREKAVALLLRWVMLFHLFSVFLIVMTYFHGGSIPIKVSLGNWYEIGHYGFDLSLLLDRISIPLLVNCSFLLNVIGYFCVQYLHRDPGYFRYCTLYLFFTAGISLVIAAGTVDLLFAGWEILGLSSSLLIGFYHTRRGPALNGYTAFIYYRFCDVFLLSAAVFWHQLSKTSHIPLPLSEVSSATHWTLSSGEFTLVGLLFLFASLAKSAQLPMTGWLPKAMEGPTPSSAIFYGSLSIHAGAYLLLRMSPVLYQSEIVPKLIFLIGGLTAFYGALVGRTKADAKTLLAYASVSQVGIIYMEIGVGWTQLATIHTVGHSLVRALQILRSPSLLHDFRQFGFEPVLGVHSRIEFIFPEKIRTWVYRQALAEGNWDTFLSVFLARPLFALSRFLEKLESRFMALFGGEKSCP